MTNRERHDTAHTFKKNCIAHALSVSNADFVGEVEAGVESIRQGPACTERFSSLLFIELAET